MPTCCVEGCGGSSNKGDKMSMFPRDEMRRNIWIKNINRKNWTYKPHCSVCERHFAPVMWERLREDGTKKLRYFAVPTIFPDGRVLKYEVPQIPSLQNSMNESSDSCEKLETEYDSLIVGEENDDAEDDEEDDMEMEYLDEVFEFQEQKLDSDEKIVQETKDLHAFKKQIGRYRKGVSPETQLERTELLLKRSERLRSAVTARYMFLKDKHKSYKREKAQYLATIENLEQRVRNVINSKTNLATTCNAENCSATKLRENLKKLFNENQIKLLTGQLKRVPQWDEATLLKAHELHFTLGRAGYEELMNLGIPLPSLRSLRRNLKEAAVDEVKGDES